MQARSNDARTNWEEALASKDRAIAQLEKALSTEREAAEQARTAAAAATSQAQARTGGASATEAALADARTELDRLRQQACRQLPGLPWLKLCHARRQALYPLPNSSHDSFRLLTTMCSAQVALQEAHRAEARRAAAAAASAAADRLSRAEHTAAMAQACTHELQATLDQRGSELKQQQARAEVRCASQSRPDACSGRLC